ncbi:MAG: hypothetical protein HKO94_08215, partial [Flavobacteriaceae bacterium]|nr:hypothetical protein [Flavobacteriaceae bacterium]
MKKIFHLAIIVSIGLFLNSCYYDSIYEPIDTGNGEDPIEVSYQNDIIPLWVQCVG